MTALLSSILAAEPVHIAVPQVAWRALLPIVILLVGGVVVLTIASLTRKRRTTRWYAWFTVAVALAAGLSAVPLWARVQGWDTLAWWTLPASPRGPFSTVAGAIGVDGFGLYVAGAICASVILAALLADGYLRREDLNGPEFYALLLIAGAGGVIMAMSNDFIVLFLGLETLSIASYVLTSMHLRRAQSQEGGLKYFVLGAFSSAFLLYGIALVYGATGSTSLIKIRDFFGASVTAVGVATPGNVPIHNGLLMVGVALMLVGLGFKIAAVPFHSWSPDAYDGAPSPAVAFMAGAVKAAAFAALVRIFVLALPTLLTTWRPIMQVLAALSLVVGASLAIVQTNIKRTLAYSSINHAGFILMAVSSGTALGTSAVLVYLAAYAFMVAGSFGVVGLVSRRGDSRTNISDYRGLSRSSPVLAGTLTVFLLAQAGVPLTSGFFAKFSAINAAVETHAYWLALLAMVSAVIAAFLYLRIIVAMYLVAPDEATPTGAIRVPFSARLALGLCVLVTVAAGVFPSLLAEPASHGTPYLVQPPRPTPPPAGTAGSPATPPTSSLGAASAGG